MTADERELILVLTRLTVSGGRWFEATLYFPFNVCPLVHPDFTSETSTLHASQARLCTSLNTSDIHSSKDLGDHPPLSRDLT